eukprot:TRINITY_DN65847_c0_g1_i1.p1 TRINITY_DN65847_c0_g1~~TRINITY_DN65847_c0_g1_i1.p1  ORF type:complete len:194 (+),score=39.43 TRINITY_DN65847_c0_g1_i1:98-679(+)
MAASTRALRDDANKTKCGPPSACSCYHPPRRNSLPRVRSSVSFCDDVELVILTPPSPRQQAPAALKKVPKASHQAAEASEQAVRANLRRLRTNHMDFMQNACFCGAFWKLLASNTKSPKGKTAAADEYEGEAAGPLTGVGRGRLPGGAMVSTIGCTVAIREEGGATQTFLLKSRAEARNWASQLLLTESVSEG